MPKVDAAISNRSRAGDCHGLSGLAMTTPKISLDKVLFPIWHLSKPKDSEKTAVVAEPVVNDEEGAWHIRIREIGHGAGQLRHPPEPTFSRGKGISLFTKRPIPPDYMKAVAQQGRMRSQLYALVVATPQGLKFQPPEQEDFDALRAAERELARLRPGWERTNIIPTEKRSQGDCDRVVAYGLSTWADLFSPRQLLCMGVLVEELRNVRAQIFAAEKEDCLLYTSPSPRDATLSRMPSSA